MPLPVSQLFQVQSSEKHFLENLKSAATFVVDLNGKLVDASGTSLAWLGFADTPDDWKNRSWHSKLSRGSECFAAKWNARDRQACRYSFCHSRRRGSTGEVAIVRFELLSELSAYIATVNVYSMSVGPRLFRPDASGMRYQVGFISVPEKKVFYAQHLESSPKSFSTNLTSLKAWTDYIQPNERHDLEKRLERLVEGKVPFVSMKCRSSSTKILKETFDFRFLSVIRDESGRSIVIKFASLVYSRNRKSATELHLGKGLLEHVRESVIATDLEGLIYFWGKGAERLYGWKADEVVGRSVLLITDKSDRAAEESRMKDVFSNGFWSGRCYQIRKDGSKFLASAYISLVNDDEGNPVGYVGIDHDITEWLDQQRKIDAMQTSLASAQLLAIRGELLAGCCHELCQPIFAIQNLINSLKRIVDSKDKESNAHKLIDMCSREVTRAAEISENLRDCVNDSRANLKICDANAILLDCVDVGRIYAELAGITFDFQTAIETVEIECDEIQIRHVILNLIRNALDSLSETDTNDKTVLLSGDIRGESFVYSVIDSGGGVRDDCRDKIFAPFFTTKKTGTGIGLTLCRSIVEKHGGSLELTKSIPLKITHFEAVLPIAKSQELKAVPGNR